MARALHDRFRAVSLGPEGKFRYPVGDAGLAGLGYDEATTARLPAHVRAHFCGVGNPFATVDACVWPPACHWPESAPHAEDVPGTPCMAACGHDAPDAELDAPVCFLPAAGAGDAATPPGPRHGLRHDRCLPPELAACPVRPGNTVLDAGCGAGVDTLLAAMLAGPTGRVTGVDASPHMLASARANLASASTPETASPNGEGPGREGPGGALPGSAPVWFLQSGVEMLPFAPASFDVVISNGLFSLVVDKAAALREIHRVLKPGGRLRVADQSLTGAAPQGPDILSSWFR